MGDVITQRAYRLLCGQIASSSNRLPDIHDKPDICACCVHVVLYSVFLFPVPAHRTTFSVDPDTHIDSIEQAEQMTIEGTSKWSCKIAITGIDGCILSGRWSYILTLKYRVPNFHTLYIPNFVHLNAWLLYESKWIWFSLWSDLNIEFMAAIFSSILGNFSAPTETMLYASNVLLYY